MFVFNREQLLQSLWELDDRGRSVFAASCVQRVAPHYDEYCKNARSGNPKMFHGVLEMLWSDLSEKSSYVNELRSALGRVEDLFPEESDANEMANAEYAILALECAVDSRLSGDPNSALQAAEQVYNIADTFAMEDLKLASIDREVEKLVTGHPTVQEELRRQQHDLATLTANLAAENRTPSLVSLQLQRESSTAPLRFLRKEKLAP